MLLLRTVWYIQLDKMILLTTHCVNLLCGLYIQREVSVILVPVVS